MMILESKNRLVNTDLGPCTYLPTPADDKLLERPDIINEQVHELQLVAEGDEDVGKGYAECFLRKLSVQLKFTVH